MDDLELEKFNLLTLNHGGLRTLHIQSINPQLWTT